MKIVYIEDKVDKYMAVKRALDSLGITDVCRAKDSETGIEKIEQAIAEGQPYDLLISDMHFPIDGEFDRNAGEKTMQRLRDRGINIPVIFCSSQNWKIPGAVDTIFYNEMRDLQQDIKAALEKVKKLQE